VFDDRAEGLLIVDTGNLAVAFSDEACFVLVDSTAGGILNFVHPLAFDNVTTGRRRHQNLGTVLH
jgi:hypothetical protein